MGDYLSNFIGAGVLNGALHALKQQQESNAARMKQLNDQLAQGRLTHDLSNQMNMDRSNLANSPYYQQLAYYNTNAQPWGYVQAGDPPLAEPHYETSSRVWLGWSLVWIACAALGLYFSTFMVAR